jgi:short-subunit dehydrogenase
VASVLGKIPAPYYSTYTASKYGIVGFNAALRQELAQNEETDIKVCTVMPMAHDTPFFDHAGNYTGHEATPIPPVYDPQQCVDTIVDLAENPEDEVIVGTQGKVSAFMHELAPGIMEKLMGALTHKKQIEDAPPAPVTAGSVHEPRESD